MPADPLGRTIRCPHCGQEIQLGEAIANQLTAPLRILWEEEREDYETRIAKLQTQLGRVNRDLLKTQRRTRTGSPTEEGYARQDLFADELRRRFPEDQITPVHRGQAGADVTQVVRYGEADCGAILWEVKRAANWVAAWPAKLVADRDAARALIGVIVSESLPAGIASFGQVGEVWVSSFADAADLALVLRMLVVTAWRHEVAAAQRAGNAEKVFNYVMTGNFSRRFERLTSVAASLLHDLDLDRRALERRWKRTEIRIREILDIRDAVGDDLLDAIGADAELPAGLRAELPETDVDDELPIPLDGPALALEPPQQPRTEHAAVDASQTATRRSDAAPSRRSRRGSSKATKPSPNSE
jgi:hypothetical protein